MTVRELIVKLTEYEMDCDIEIVGNQGFDYEVFNDFDLNEQVNVSGVNSVQFDFQLDDKVIVDKEEYEELIEMYERLSI